MMAPDLRSRLSRIRELNGMRRSRKIPDPLPEPPPASFEKLGWLPAGFMTLKRDQSLALPLPIPPVLPRALAILVSDFPLTLPEPEELLFFDLETTGLSGGAGTVAFLAAFGRLSRQGGQGSAGQGSFALSLTQYLLLDYPGEADFLEAVLGEFAGQPWAVSYNGKTFDAQILKTRFLMNGMAPPDYAHADLLYPARRLWKRVLPDCSQGTIEQEILGLDRTGDVGGAFAPEIWFNFLKDGDPGPLLTICDHNLRDIRGLASLLGCLCAVAAGPLGAVEKYRVDGEQLALRWRYAVRQGLAEDPELAGALLEAAAEAGYPRACRCLAMDLEWGRGDLVRALALTERALSDPERLSGSLRADLESRRERLLKKGNALTKRSGHPG
jgi:uncharacterized protein YprB with RNaseH-like and TPR domain